MPTLILSASDASRVRYEADYDAATRLLTVLRAINDSNLGPTPAPSSGRVWLVEDPARDFPPGAGTDPKKARVTQPGVTEEAPIPAGRSIVLNIVTLRGRQVPTNLDGEFIWPI